MNDIQSETTRRRPQGGPPLLALALPYAALTLVGLALGIGLGRPDDTPAELARVLIENQTAASNETS